MLVYILEVVWVVGHGGTSDLSRSIVESCTALRTPHLITSANPANLRRTVGTGLGLARHCLDRLNGILITRMRIGGRLTTILADHRFAKTAGPVLI